MCELVQELGLHYQMQPEALANNVIFTIGKLAHKHSENAKLLTRSSIPLIVQSLKLYGMDKVTPFALHAVLIRTLHGPEHICELLLPSDQFYLNIFVCCRLLKLATACLR
jgi:hypothetical protein